MRLVTKKIAHEFEFDAIAGCLNYFRQGPPPFIRARSSLSPTPNYKIICATFSFNYNTGKWMGRTRRPYIRAVHAGAHARKNGNYAGLSRVRNIG